MVTGVFRLLEMYFLWLLHKEDIVKLFTKSLHQVYYVRSGQKKIIFT